MSWFSARQESKEREIEANKNFKTNTGASRKETSRKYSRHLY